MAHMTSRADRTRAAKFALFFLPQNTEPAFVAKIERGQT